MKKILVIFITFLLLSGCSNQEKENINIHKLMNENEYIIIDVRTKEEYIEEHVIDAINIPYDEINEDIEIDKDKLIFVYCKSGNRSNIAYNTLIELGYVVYDLGAISDIDLEKEKSL